MVNAINNRQIRLVVTIEDMEKSQNLFYTYTKAWNNYIIATLSQLSPSPLLEFPISDNDKEYKSKGNKEFLRKIDSLFEDSIFADQEDIIITKEVAAIEEEVVAKKEEVVEN
ncbi:hypothetical protein PVK06_011275 [Gossypium arboreum]|uniref:Uncharacterized protein n=1 Tax=Gossypium arboreum TaxID=29729 RepID=A0ABR0Q9L8_GOSAR|nr:hypothetical protein PVK06_011275 [Gossypium arboreum]